MSGHSKWSTIKRKKSAEDAKRGKMFTRLAREIAICAREGGGDPDVNFRLRLAIDRARIANMPKDNIERAIARGAGGLKGEDLEEMYYEGYAPHGVALLVQTLTDNRNRTIAQLRRTFNRLGGSLAEAGAVAWQFERKGYITIELDGVDAEQVFEIVVDSGAEDVVTGDDLIEVYADLDDFQSVQEALQVQGIKLASAELAMIPKTAMQLEPSETMKVMNVIDGLEDLDDVQQVYSNLDISDKVIAQFEAAA